MLDTIVLCDFRQQEHVNNCNSKRSLVGCGVLKVQLLNLFYL